MAAWLSNAVAGAVVFEALRALVRESISRGSVHGAQAVRDVDTAIAVHVAELGLQDTSTRMPCCAAGDFLGVAAGEMPVAVRVAATGSGRRARSAIALSVATNGAELKRAA